MSTAGAAFSVVHSTQPSAGVSFFSGRKTFTPREMARERKPSTSPSGCDSSHRSTVPAPHSLAASSTAWALQNRASEYFSPRRTVPAAWRR